MLVAVGKVLGRSVFRFTAFLAAFVIASVREFTAAEFQQLFQIAWPYGLVFVAIGLGYDVFFRANKTPWRYTSTLDVLILVRGSVFTILTFLLAIFIIDRAFSLPRSTLLLSWVIDLGLITGFLVLRRAIYEGTLMAALVPFMRKSAESGTPTMLIGSLDSADAFLRDVGRERTSSYRPVAIITRDRIEVGKELRGIRVLTDFANAAQALMEFAEGEGERAVVFLDQGVVPADISTEVLGHLRGRGLKFLRQARLIDSSATTLREIDLEELLSRQPVKLDNQAIKDLVSGRRVLVTGAGGSIGSEICRQVAALGCAHIGLLDSSEFALFTIDAEIGRAYPTLSRSDILCDVRDSERISAWVENEHPDIIFHAAALKHVPLMENHPCESVLTNVIGTWNVAEAAKVNQVGGMVFISTDKAVEPGNVMGATKRLAEAVIRVHQASSTTRFSVVRFGNVLGSAGSVVPTFRAQIERGGPVTVTHPDVERYFMTIPEAVQLVLHATARSANREQTHTGVFVLDMGEPVKIMDLARRLIELYDKVPGVDIEIRTTGLRPGERLQEHLVDSNESARPASGGVIEVFDRVKGLTLDKSLVQRLETAGRSGDSALARRLIFQTLDLVRAVPADAGGKVPEGGQPA